MVWDVMDFAKPSEFIFQHFFLYDQKDSSVRNKSKPPVIFIKKLDL